MLDEDAHSQSGSFASATQQCFALKQGLDPLLDLARITFTQVTEEIHDLVAAYRTSHKMPVLKASLPSAGSSRGAAGSVQGLGRAVRSICTTSCDGGCLLVILDRSLHAQLPAMLLPVEG